MYRKTLELFIVIFSLVFLGCATPVTPEADQAITLFIIPDVKAPVSGITPVTSIDTNQYKGTISWSPTFSGTFATATVYTANLALIAKAGWTFTGVTANSFKLEGATTTNEANTGTVLAIFPATEVAPDQAINEMIIPGVVAPVRGVAPETTAIDTTQYTGTITWSPSASVFAASTVYTANIVLTTKVGWTMAGVGENSFSVEGASATNPTDSGMVVAVFPITGSPADIDVTFSDATQVGGISDTTSSTSLTLTFSFDPTTLAASDIIVTGATTGALSGSGTTRSLTIAAITVANGATVSVAVASPVGYSIAGSPRTAVLYKAPVVVSLLAIPGVVVPVQGSVPVTTDIDTSQYTGTITWVPSVSTFLATTVYMANIALTAKTGYTLNGVAANSFTITGATATNAANTGTVAAIFPATAAAPITLLSIPGVVAPVRGAVPVTTAINTAQYTGTITWAPSASIFAATTVYTTNITLTPKAGWTLNGVSANSFNVLGATATNAANTGTVAAIFPATSAAPITLLTIPGVVAPVRGAIPVTTNIYSTQYTGTISWSPVDSSFAASTIYTANIVLTAQSGYTLTGVIANSFTVAGATATNAVNTGNIAAVFPATTVPIPITLDTVPAGSFQRDATASNISIISSEYRMSAHEITREQFVGVTGLDPSRSYFADVVNGPVQRTYWYHALVFCNKLSMAEGLTPAYTISGSTDPATWGVVPTYSDAIWGDVTSSWSANGNRLPREMEWTWGAMGATSDRSNGYTGSGTNTTGYTKGYAGSTEAGGAQVNIGDYAWYNVNSNSTTHTVGGKTGNELGLYDMSGNVSEWCWDSYAVYTTGTLTDYRGAASSGQRVIRGGDWDPFEDSALYRVAYRYSVGPGSLGSTFGSRVVRP